MRTSKLSKRVLGILAAASALAGAQPLGAQSGQRTSAPSAARPNVLLIMIDDLKPTLRSFGDQTAISPNIDRLAARGTRFEHAYANQAVCAPSRINLMTGRRSTSTGIYDFGMDFRQYIPNAVSMPQLFKQAGYSAESIGKVYHVGHGTNDDLASWSRPPIHDHVIEYVDPANKARPTREEALFYEVPVPENMNVWRYAATLDKGAPWESPDVPDNAYADGRTAAAASKRLRELKAAKTPFFLAVGFARPHLPFSVPKRYWDMYDPAKLPMPTYEVLPEGAPAFAGKTGGEIVAYKEVPERTAGKDYPEALKRKLIHGYYAGVSYTDAQIGKVLDALQREGLAENTIVVLWGDHGWHLGDHGIWTKHTNFEQATRQPLIMAGPGIDRGASAAQIAETVDVFPTLTALAGLKRPAKMQPLDGMNLTPALHDATKTVRPYAYHAYNRGVRVGQAIRTAQYRLVRWVNGEGGERVYELYDLKNDPGETRNVAASQPQVRAELERYLDAQPAPVSTRRAAQRATKPD